MNRSLLLLLAVIAATACDRGSNAPAPQTEPADAADAPARTTLTEGWQEPGSGWISVRRERPYDLTGDGEPERVIATAEGESYDSLQVVLHITDARGDTLWMDRWPSLLYFKYDPLEGKADTTVARIVQAHVDTLVHVSRFSASGLPPMLRQGTGSDGVDESLRYHLAEIDYRGRANLEARDPTPPDSYDRIRAETVIPERVQAVRQEVQDKPTFMYYAGGEATYAIGWSVREQSFVRLYSCC